MATPIMQTVSVKMMVVGAGSGWTHSMTRIRGRRRRMLDCEEAMYSSTAESTRSQRDNRRQPRTPPVRMSAGLWTPRYMRLNMTQNDHSEMIENRTISSSTLRS